MASIMRAEPVAKIVSVFLKKILKQLQYLIHNKCSIYSDGGKEGRREEEEREKKNY